MSEDQMTPVMGIGSCLAGNAVRYNKQTKSPNQHVRAIAENFEMRAFCPEMGIGMGVPRAPIHLVGTEDEVRALDVASGPNVTALVPVVMPAENAHPTGACW